jgi:hypothetical protein
MSLSLGAVLNVQLNSLPESLSALIPDELGLASLCGVNGQLDWGILGAADPARDRGFKENMFSSRPTFLIYIRRFSISNDSAR